MVSTSQKVREVLYEDESTGDSALALLFVEDIFTDPDEYAEGAEWGVVARCQVYTADGEESHSVETHLPYGFAKFEDALECAADPDLNWHEFEIFA